MTIVSCGGGYWDVPRENQDGTDAGRVRQATRWQAGDIGYIQAQAQAPQNEELEQVLSWTREISGRTSGFPNFWAATDRVPRRLRRHGLPRRPSVRRGRLRDQQPHACLGWLAAGNP